MTTIATDGLVVASDSVVSVGSSFLEPFSVNKIITRNDRIFAFSGVMCLFEAMIQWYLDGHKSKDIPVFRSDKPDDCSWFWVFDNGKLIEFSNQYPYPMELKAPVAMGSGSYYASTAFVLGAGAELAVKAAIRCDPFSRGPVSIVELPEALRIPRCSNFQPLAQISPLKTNKVRTTNPKPHPHHTNGGKARAAKLSPERRSEIARLGAQKRWKGRQDDADY